MEYKVSDIQVTPVHTKGLHGVVVEDKSLWMLEGNCVVFMIECRSEWAAEKFAAVMRKLIERYGVKT